MTSPLTTSGTYLETIEAFFLGLKGRGLMLSPADAHLVDGFEAAGVPAEVVCRGVARAFQVFGQRGDQGPRSLQGCSSFIEEEIDRWQRRGVGRNQWTPDSDVRRVDAQLGGLLARIEAAGRDSSEPARTYHRRVFRLVRDLRRGLRHDETGAPRVVRSLLGAESRLLAELWTGLSPEQARAWAQEAHARVALDPGVASERALADARRAARETILCERLGLVPLRLEP